MEEDKKIDWLTDSFLNEVLQSVEKTKEITILKYWAEAAVPPGVNNLSLLYRVNVEYSLGTETNTRSKKLIVKTPLESGYFKEIAEKTGGYAREVKVYGEVLPKMYKLLDCRVTPESYVCPMHHSLVLEDLREKGYRMSDRLKQLDLAHCKLIMQSLAKFHALSIALHKKEPALIEDGAGFNKDEKEFHEGIAKFGLNAVLTTLEDMPDCESYIEKIKRKRDILVDMFEAIRQPADDGWNVLCHRDLWTSNLLFKYTESGQAVDAKILDFQNSKYGLIAEDILFFWITSANKDVRDNHREEVFETYRQQMNETLKELCCEERLTKEVFNRHIRKMAPSAVLTAAWILAIFMADPEDLLDISKLSNLNSEEEEGDFHREDPQMRNYRSKYYRDLLPQVLRQAEQLGAFD